MTWRADGEWVTLLTTSVGFGYDGSNVFNVSSSHQDAAQNGYQEGSGPYWQDPRTQGYSLPNSWWWVRYYNATYYFWGFYDHEKNNKVWEYYNGTCSFEGQHYGYVPRGGYVQLTLTQW